MISENELEKAMNWLRDHASLYAKAKAERVYLSEYRKTKLAMLMRQAEIEGHKTISAQEREAYANSEYVELLTALKDATEREEEERFMIKAAEVKIDIWRTRQANERIERKGYGA